VQGLAPCDDDTENAGTPNPMIVRTFGKHIPKIDFDGF